MEAPEEYPVSNWKSEKHVNKIDQNPGDLADHYKEIQQNRQQIRGKGNMDYEKLHTIQSIDLRNQQRR